MRLSKTPVLQKVQPSRELNQPNQHIKIVTICLKNAFEAILKRLQGQVFSKIIANSARHNQKKSTLKFISYISSNLLRRKKQLSFDKIKNFQHLYLIRNKAAILLAFYGRRIVKNQIKSIWLRLRFLRAQQKSIVRRKSSRKSAGEVPSPRMSDQSQKSNILTISEDNFSEKHDQQFQDKRDYANSNGNGKHSFAQIQQLKKMELSHHFRQTLHQMERYDIFTDPETIIEALNDPISDELRRLQLVKRENKIPKNKVFDNQLTLACLFDRVRALHHQSTKTFQFSQTSAKGTDYLTSQELTTLNIITAVVRARQYKDIKRQIEFFVKKTSKKELAPLFREVLAAFQSFQNIQEANKSKDKDKQGLNNMVSLLDKHLRAEKYDEVEKLKNKLKSSAEYYQFSALLDTIVGISAQLRKFKKKQFTSVDRMLKSPKHKNIQEQNESLKQQLKVLQFKLKDLQVQNQKLKDTMKKNVERVHPSLLPKKAGQKQPPNITNGAKNQDILKKYKQLEATMQKKIESISKQTTAKLEKAKQDQKKLSQKIKQLEFQLQNSQNQSRTLNSKIREKQDFLQMYQIVTKKLLQKESYVRDINEFKKKYVESRFIQIIEKIITQQSNRNTLLTQLKSVITSFDDNSWKRKQNNLFLKTEGEIYANINVLIDRNLAYYKQKQEGKGIEKQLNVVKKTEERLLGENMSLKEQLSELKKQIKQARDQLDRINSQKPLKTEFSESNSKIKTPERIHRSSVDKQVADLRAQNSKLKVQLQNNSKNASFQEKAQKTQIYKKQLEDGTNVFEMIKAKKNKSQSFVKDINQFKRGHPKSFLVEIFETISKEEAVKLQLVGYIKTLVSSFSDSSWKKRQNNLLLKEQNDLNSQINSLIGLIINLSKMTDQSKYTTLTTQLKNIKTILSDNTWKRRQNGLIVKEQSQLHTVINQIIQFAVAQLNQKEQLAKSKTQLQQLRQKVGKLENQVKNLRQNKNREKVQQNSKELANQRNQRAKIQKELQNYLQLNQQLKRKVLESDAKISQIQLVLASHQRSQKQLQSLIKLYQTIKSKKILGQSPIKQVNQYKKSYQNSLSLQIVDVLYSNIIEEYNKTTKEIPSRKNTQLLVTQQRQKDERKDLQMQKLRQENSRLKSEFKTRPQSPETKEKLNIQRQKTLNQMREINQLKLEIERFKLQNIRYKDELQNALKTNALVNLEFERVSSQLEKTKKQTAAKKEQEFSQQTQSLNKKLEELQSMTVEWGRRQINYIGQQKQSEQKAQALLKCLQQSQLRQMKLEQNLQNYKILYQKVKQQRNNLILMLDQKNEQFEITKENEELYYRQRDQKQDKIIELKHRFEETEVDIKQIENQIEKVLAEKTAILNKCNQDLQSKEREISELRATIQLKEKVISDLHNKIQLELVSFKNAMVGKQNEKNYLQNQMGLQNQEIQLLKQTINSQVLELRLRCEQLTKQLKHLQDQKISQFSPSLLIQSNKIPINHFPEDYQKLELRKQLELVNQEMAALVRNSQNQKRQLRQYMQKLSNQMQMQNVLYNQEKKMLKEDIQRAKNEEYQINQEKLARLRADIQGLRIQNQRLASIIDHNQQAFHQLIDQHREMTLKIEHLEDFNQSLAQQNHQLTNDIYKAGQQKLELALKLQPLQQKLAELQGQIALALQEKKQNELQMFRSSQAKQNALQSTINKLNHQNRMLEAKIANQSKSLLQMHQNILRLQSQLSQQKEMTQSEANRIQSGDYSKYLQQKIDQQNQSIKRLSANQYKLVQKIQQLIKDIGQLEKERVQLQSEKRQRDYQLSKLKETKPKEAFWEEKCAYLEHALSQNEKELSFWKSFKVQSTPQTQQQQNKIKRLEQLANSYQNEAYKFKKMLEEKSSENVALQSKSEQNLKLNIEIKHLNSKIQNLNQDVSQLQQRLYRSQNEINQLKRQKSVLLENYSPDNRFQQLKQHALLKQRQEEINWLKGQMLFKDAELQKVRLAQLDLSKKLKLCHQQIIHYEHQQLRYNAELNSFQDLKRQLSQIQLFYQNQIKTIKDHERNALENQQRLQIQIQELHRQNQTLSRENRQLFEAKQAKKMYNYALRELVLQLDEHFNFDSSDQQLQLRILQKINQEISTLLFQNNKLKQKCLQIQNTIYSKNWQQPRQQTILQLQKLTQDILSYLKHQQLINPEDLDLNLKLLLNQPTSNSELYVENLTIFIKNVISSINKDSLQLLMLYNSKIDRIQGCFEVYMHKNSHESFRQLKNAIFADLKH